MYIYIDLSKTFDTLNYDILMSKLEYYGITGKENDLLNIFDMLMYADDTTLFCNMADTITVDVINEELSKICDWLGANKLSLNIVKIVVSLH